MFLNSVCLVLCASIVMALPDYHWQAYKNEYGKSYENPIEDALRRKIFMQDKDEVERFNAGESSKAGYSKGLNQMSDWTEDELKSTLGFRMGAANTIFKRTESAQKFLDNLLARVGSLPESVDWRNVKNRVTRVKDQGKCGSCWAFSTTGLLEGQEVNHSTTSGVELSEQDLVDCSVLSNGCHGGNMANAVAEISAMGGIDDEKSYPYKARKQRSCYFNETNSIITDRGPLLLEAGDEVLLQESVAEYGPIAIAVSATKNWFQYKSGILNDPECDDEVPNHGVLLVGYGTENTTGRDYWIIKNSWGANWGMDGYLLLDRNKDNHCNVATFPVMAYW